MNLPRNGIAFSGTPFARREVAAVSVGYLLGVVAVLLAFTTIVDVDGEHIEVVAAAVPPVPFLVASGVSCHLQEFRGGPIRGSVPTGYAGPSSRPDSERRWWKSRRSLGACGHRLRAVPGRSRGTYGPLDQPRRRAVPRQDRGVSHLHASARVRGLCGRWPVRRDDAHDGVRSQYAVDPRELYEHVASERILESARVVRDPVGTGTTNRDALEAVDRAETDVLPVVERQEGLEEFVDVVSQDSITRGLLLERLRRDRTHRSDARGTNS